MDEYDIQENSVGWISISDIFLLTSIILFICSITAFQLYEKTNKKLNELEIQHKTVSNIQIQHEEEFALKDRLISQLKQKLEKLELENTTLQNLLDTKEQKLIITYKKIEGLEKVIIDLQNRITFLKKQNVKYEEYIKLLMEKFKKHQKKTEQQKLQDYKEKVIRQELMGIKGKMDKVVFIFDRSGSMTSNIEGSDRNRWQEALEIVKSWLEYLPVKECVLIIFNQEVEVFPLNKNGSLISMIGEEGKQNRKLLIKWLKEVNPNGSTNTEAAIQEASRYKDIGNIILFTDGAPTVGVSTTSEDYNILQNHVLQLCKTINIPINVVGLGDYYSDKKFGKFLLAVAEVTGGSFRGR